MKEGREGKSAVAKSINDQGRDSLSLFETAGYSGGVWWYLQRNQGEAFSPARESIETLKKAKNDLGSYIFVGHTNNNQLLQVRR